MTQILVVYQEQPRFPASDQHPSATRYSVGSFWVDAIGDAPSEAEVYARISPSKEELCLRVSVDAEACRQRFITPGSGKAMDYLEKHNQANAVHDLGQEVANALSESDRRAQFPTLAASVGREAPTLWECAQIVIARYEAWATLSFYINTAELDGKIAIRDASDAAAARAAYEAITWPSP